MVFNSVQQSEIFFQTIRSLKEMSIENLAISSLLWNSPKNRKNYMLLEDQDIFCSRRPQEQPADWCIQIPMVILQKIHSDVI